MLNQRTLIQTSALMIGSVLLLKLLGLTEKIVLAATFGTGKEADAALVATNGALLFGVMLFDVIAPALIPLLVGQERLAQERTSGTLLSIWVLMLSALALLGWLFGPQLVGVLGPGLDAPTRALALIVLKGGLVALPLFGAAAILTCQHHASGRYLQPALAELCMRAGPLIGLLVLGSLDGLAIGLASGALLRAIALVLPSQPIRPRWALHDATMRRSFQQVWPLLLTSIISLPLFAAIETALATTISGGAAAALAYARRIADLPIVLVPQVIAKVIFPTLAGLARDARRMERELRRAIELTLLSLLPLAILGFVLAEPIVRLIYARGAFTEESVAITTAALRASLPGLPTLGLLVIVSRFVYALGDTRKPSVLQVFTTALHIGLAFGLRPWGVVGIAIASTLTLWVQALSVTLLVAYNLRIVRRLFQGSGWPSARLLLGSLLTALVASWLEAQLPAGQATLAILQELVLVSLAGLATYIGSMFLLGARPNLRGAAA